MQNIFLTTVSLVFLTLLTGCRIGVSVFEGGDVVSSSTQRNCFEGTNCEFTVDDPLFTETFTAKPRNGFVFTRWRAGERFLCANSTDPVCTVDLAGIASADLIISSDLMSYLVPEFTCVGNCPERPDGIVRGLDEALVAMYAARDAINAYVATNDGDGAPDPQLYGVNLGTTGSSMLRDLDIYPGDTSQGGGYTFYIVANVYRRVWGDTDNPWSISTFALSGQTNNDNSMTWQCVPGHPRPGQPGAIPYEWLPAFCRI